MLHTLIKFQAQYLQAPHILYCLGRMLAQINKRIEVGSKNNCMSCVKIFVNLHPNHKIEWIGLAFQDGNPTLSIWDHDFGTAIIILGHYLHIYLQ